MTSVPRRDLLRYSAAGAIATVTALVVTQLRSEAAPAGPPSEVGEIYKGRRITIVPAGLAAAGHRRGAHADTVLIDGVPLHVMANDDGTYTSVVNHYESHRSLRRLAHAAVDDLGGARLVHQHHR
jgi:hypothetical protein